MQNDLFHTSEELLGWRQRHVTSAVCPCISNSNSAVAVLYTRMQLAVQTSICRPSRDNRCCRRVSWPPPTSTMLIITKIIGNFDEFGAFAIKFHSRLLRGGGSNRFFFLHWGEGSFWFFIIIIRCACVMIVDNGWGLFNSCCPVIQLPPPSLGKFQSWISPCIGIENACSTIGFRCALWLPLTSSMAK